MPDWLELMHEMPATSLEDLNLNPLGWGHGHILPNSTYTQTGRSPFITSVFSGEIVIHRREVALAAAAMLAVMAEVLPPSAGCESITLEAIMERIKNT